jgi:hypothetical protein
MTKTKRLQRMVAYVEQRVASDNPSLDGDFMWRTIAAFDSLDAAVLHCRRCGSGHQYRYGVFQ